jgi:hypothetical protein
MKQFQQLQKDNLRQGKLIASLYEKNTSDAAELAALKQQVNILKAASGEMNEADKKNFEKEIDKQIKAVDKCINYLSE